MSASDSNFKKALNFTLRWEGGYVNNPADKGGETNFGITAATYNQYRKARNLDIRSVRYITTDEVNDIYYLNYWNKAGCGNLPNFLALAHFDWAVNSGCGRAIMTLQQVAGASVDGILGAETKAAVTAALLKYKEVNLCRDYCELREKSYRRWAIGNQAQFLKGWLNRLNALRDECLI